MPRGRGQAQAPGCRHLGVPARAAAALYFVSAPLFCLVPPPVCAFLSDVSCHFSWSWDPTVRGTLGSVTSFCPTTPGTHPRRRLRWRPRCWCRSDCTEAATPCAPRGFGLFLLRLRPRRWRRQARVGGRPGSGRWPRVRLRANPLLSSDEGAVRPRVRFSASRRVLGIAPRGGFRDAGKTRSEIFTAFPAPEETARRVLPVSCQASAKFSAQFLEVVCLCTGRTAVLQLRGPRRSEFVRTGRFPPCGIVRAAGRGLLSVSLSSFSCFAQGQPLAHLEVVCVWDAGEGLQPAFSCAENRLFRPWGPRVGLSGLVCGDGPRWPPCRSSSSSGAGPGTCPRPGPAARVCLPFWERSPVPAPRFPSRRSGLFHGNF